MKKYSVVPTARLRSLCIENRWFTEGTSMQYEKLFYANENDWPVDDITTIIWLCSDSSKWSLQDIFDELLEAREQYKELIGEE